MQRKYLFGSCLFILALLAQIVDAESQGDGLNRPVPEAALQALKDANGLADQEKFAAAALTLKKAIAAAPVFLEAHIRYIYLRAYFMDQELEVEAEYKELMESNPANPVYPAALAIALIGKSKEDRRSGFEVVAKLATDWNWSHYARAQILLDKEPDAALSELMKMTGKEPLAVQAYDEAISIQRFRLKKMDGAIATAREMYKHPELRPAAQGHLWRLNLVNAGTTDDAKMKLRKELTEIAGLATDIATLAVIHSAYVELLADKEAAGGIEKKILRIDASWYPERGIARSATTYGEKGPYMVIYAGRQLAIFNKLRAIDYDLSADEQIARLKQLMLLKPNAQMRQKLLTRFFGAAERAGDNVSIVKFGEVLLRYQPNDASILSTVASALANQKKGLAKALIYVRLAEEVTRQFYLVKDIKGIAGNKFFEEYYSEKEQVQRHKTVRGQILESYGWVLYQSGKYSEAEAKLRESLELDRTERKLSRLARVLQSLDRHTESAAVAVEAKDEYAASLRRRFTNLPAKDFELTTIDGHKVKLSDLRGKVVMLNFWATWCQPCLKEMPVFAKIYEKYNSQGFEILAVSVDEIEDRAKVASFAQRLRINFPVLYDAGIAKLYGAKAFPTTIFIGKQGNIRHQNFGLIMETAERDLAIIIEELLTEDARPAG